MRALSTSELIEREIYSETYIPFDWWGFLSKESYTLLELIEAQMRSGDWITCACGQANHGAGFFAGKSGRPNDSILYRLGLQFHSAIQGMVKAWEIEGENEDDFLKSKKMARVAMVRIKKRISTFHHDTSLKQKRATESLTKDRPFPLDAQSVNASLNNETCATQ